MVVSRSAWMLSLAGLAELPDLGHFTVLRRSLSPSYDGTIYDTKDIRTRERPAAELARELEPPHRGSIFPFQYVPRVSKGRAMKAVILAGGLGTRLSEETGTRPKPMVEIGGRPILWHILKMYSQHGINDFIICCGYKGYMIKEYFANYFLHMSDVTFSMKTNQMEVHHKRAEP